MAHTVFSISALKLVLAAMVAIMLFSTLVMSEQMCSGLCQGEAACDAFCKSNQWEIGRCVEVPPGVKFCCCAKYI
ncbi:hypothetical protein L6164_013180 [Bauhinia variegata]|uniref:Uncharacterized protein n=1 Tax=Bauhinia variegata TaxID=167791 RepID=A0ACB9PCH4_BAUVA|nr:hypothetical protein L6164_013180 [Bauhinia variegata]